MTPPACQLTIVARDKKARAGAFETPHGTVLTPAFMPVGTRGAVRMMRPTDLKRTGHQIILANAYHLFLSPGAQRVEEQYGSLHGLMHWPGPILTDSGGYQVFSLSSLVRVTDEGVEFRSPRDGTKHFFTPQKSMEAQRALGADVAMAFDHCLALPATKKALSQSVERTFQWGRRCLEAPLREGQYLFGIVQGGPYWDLRCESLEGLVSLNFSGYALGGFSVGEKGHETRALLERVAPRLPEDRPRYLMGMGGPTDLLHAMAQGVDLFDCVLPTRNARNGQAFTSRGPVNIKRSQYQGSLGPLDEECLCEVCQNYELATLHHLWRAREGLLAMLLTEHNLFFYQSLMKRARVAIMEGRFDEFCTLFYKTYHAQSNSGPPNP